MEVAVLRSRITLAAALSVIAAATLATPATAAPAAPAPEVTVTP